MLVTKIIRSQVGRAALVRGLSNINGYKLFGLDEKFVIDGDKLKRHMWKIMKTSHPDKFIHENEGARNNSHDFSSTVTHYYQILKNPHLRGRHLLAIKTGQSEEQIEDKIQVGQEFLSEMMELRMKIEDCEDPEELACIKRDLDRRLEDLIHKTDVLFETNRHEDILVKLGKMKFTSNCLTAVEERLFKNDKAV